MGLAPLFSRGEWLLPMMNVQIVILLDLSYDLYVSFLSIASNTYIVSPHFTFPRQNDPRQATSLNLFLPFMAES